MSSESDRAEHGGGDRLGLCIRWLVVAVVAAHATQASMSIALGEGRRALNFSVVDLALVVGLGLWLVRRLARRDFGLPPLYPAALGAAVWLALSLVGGLKGPADVEAGSLPLGLAKVIQFVEYFVAGHILFVETLREERWRRRALRPFAIAAAVSVGMAAAQYFSKGVGVTDVRGSWFDDRNSFGAFLALVLPLLFGRALFFGGRWARAAVFALVAAGLCVCLSGGAFLAMCVGVLVAAGARGRAAFAATAVGVLVCCGLVLPNLPRRNGAVLLDSVALYKESDKYGVFGRDVDKINARLEAREAALARKVAAREPVSYGDLIREEDYSWKWQQRYKEWQAGLNMMAESPLFGVGAGAYQRNVNRFYQSGSFGAMPKYPKNLLEPDTLNGYLVWGASAGAPFLVFLAAMFLRACGFAVDGVVKGIDAEARGLSAGLLGSLSALAVVTVFTNPIVRGVGVSAALVLALADAVRARAASRQGDEPEGRL